MADIQMRFHKDVLVLSSPLDHVLAKQGVDIARDSEFLNVFEPELIVDAQRLEVQAGVQCLVTNTQGITRSRLAHANLEDQAQDIAHAAVHLALDLKPQHVLALVGPCKLPLDPGSKTSLTQSRDQYAQAARDFAGSQIDAIFLDGMRSVTDLKCALMGVRKVSDLPLFASVDLVANHNDEQILTDAIAVMEDLGADVCGFSTNAPAEQVCELIKKASSVSDLPLLVQLSVGDDGAYPNADSVANAALPLVHTGAQFLRATGDATLACTGALVAMTQDLDAVR